MKLACCCLCSCFWQKSVNETLKPLLPDVKHSKRSHKAEKDRKRRKKRREGRDREEHEDQRHNGSWEHDRFLDEGRKGMKGKRDDTATVTRSPRGRQRAPLFTIDTTGGPSLFIPNPGEHVPIDPVPVQFMVKPPVEPLVEPLIEPPGERGLLLPSHVTVSAQESTPVPHEDAHLSPDSDASGIDFLNDGGRAVVCQCVLLLLLL
jgi:hypothetical protein